MFSEGAILIGPEKSGLLAVDFKSTSVIISSKAFATTLSSIISSAAKVNAEVLSWARTIVKSLLLLAVTFTISLTVESDALCKVA